MDNQFKNAINWALSLELKSEHKLPLLALISQMNENYEVEITNVAWSSLIDCSPRSILRYKKVLSEKGLIKVTRGTGTLASVYHLKIKEVENDWLTKKISSSKYFKIPKKRPAISSKIRWDVFEKDNYQCVFCGNKKELEVDHIIPIAKGGRHIMTNFQTLCRKCNEKKSDEILN